MKTRISTIGFIFLLATLFPQSIVYSSTTNGTIDTNYKYAWSENIGWINFGSTEGNVQVLDGEITGYAWSNNYGWIILNPETSGVLNDNEGDLSGYAWGENTGWINFANVAINSSGEFVGYATNDVTGQISFNCLNADVCASSDFKVTTDWRALSIRRAATGTGGPLGSGSSGSGGGGGGTTTTPTTPTSTTPTTTTANRTVVNTNTSITQPGGPVIILLSGTTVEAQDQTAPELSNLSMNMTLNESENFSAEITVNKPLILNKKAKISLAVNECPANGLTVTYLDSKQETQTLNAYCYDNKIIFWPEIITNFTIEEVVDQPLSTFNDIIDHWAFPFIEDLKLTNVVSGRTPAEFKPDDNLSRAELVKIAMELFNYPLMNISDTSFKDINSENWFYNYVGTAKELGFIQGYEDGSFKPNQSITRSEALKILLKASLKNIDTTNPADFNDVNQDQWYAPYVNWAFEKELVSGYEFGPEKGLFGPGNTITRAEISKIADLLNLLETTEITK